MKRIKWLLDCIAEGLLLILGLDCKARRQTVDDGALDHSGQGRDKYGR